MFFLMIPKPLRRLIYLGLLVGLLSVGDVYVRFWAAEQVEKRAEEAWDGAAKIEASFSGFPFVGNLAVRERVDKLTVRLTDVGRLSLRFAVIGIELKGIGIDRGKFISDREVRLTGIEAGTVFGEITAEELSRVLGIPVRLRPGAAVVTVAGREIEASVAVNDGRLVLAPAGLARLTVPIPTTEFLPCAADGAVLSGRIRVSCTIDEIPPALVQAASDAANS